MTKRNENKKTTRRPGIYVTEHMRDENFRWTYWGNYAGWFFTAKETTGITSIRFTARCHAESTAPKPEVTEELRDRIYGALVNFQQKRQS